MSRTKIAVDVDDVLADFATGFVAFSNQMWGTSLTPDDYIEHWAEMWGVSTAEALQRREVYFGSGAYCELPHDEQALGVLSRLSQDFDLCILTSRMTSLRDGTYEWIHKHYPGIFRDETIHFAGIWEKVDHTTAHKTKGDMVATLGADYLIDDQLKHCHAVAESGKTALLFGDYKWNRTAELAPNINRVADWRAVEEFFYGV